MKRFFMIMGMIGVFAVFGLGCGDDAGPGKTETKAGPAPEVTTAMESGMQKAEDAVEAATETAREAAADTAEQTREMVESAKNEAAEGADAIKAEASETAREVTETTAQVVESAREKTAEMAASAKETAAEMTAGAGEMASDAAQALSPSPAAPGSVQDIIEMKHTDAFSAHKMGIVLFNHNVHAAPAPDGYGLACGECHHDENGAPLELAEGDPVQGCMECHDKPEKPVKPQGIAAEEWAAMQLEYYYGAIHANCIDCHRAGQAGPVKCAECHPKQGG